MKYKNTCTTEGGNAAVFPYHVWIQEGYYPLTLWGIISWGPRQDLDFEYSFVKSFYSAMNRDCHLILLTV